ncbi:sodium- and chloride-dependent glycine transporter 1 isoform X1 [Strongylocentrotus purpuratus]|uniref:Transporter n=1 Tax=Strongylocentrotus purpuratus TaxID=7668 RepID=A0A7M7GIA9_STRPU|nr:sodium- and chloride-dependent glycine transporter 1 isoform X1 [Strongylocentrotus purpuratus]|eukprot:XP_003729242.1 PREDICTED: sodium- and chloride-dependent glycine transporter 1 isoform X1 [Strongylocentrotus purpuratus]
MTSSQTSKGMEAGEVTLPLNGVLSNGNAPSDDTSNLGNISKTSKSSKKEDENVERGNWSNHLDFILSCVSYAVGLGNVWRFPYLCYSNGGGAFLIPYIVMLLFAGLPLFFLELCFGQYSSSGPISAWRSAPLMKGVGYGMVAVSAWVAIYYNVIISYTMFYMFKSMTTSLPWIGCHHEWNTPYCSELVDECMEAGGIMTLNNTCVSLSNMTLEEIDSYNVTTDGNATVSFLDPLQEFRRRPSEEYYRHGVLHDSGDMGSFGYIIWPLALCLLLAWTLEFIFLAKGVKSSGKVVYFTAIFPYIVLFILLIRGMTLPGHMDGILFFIKPRWELLKNPKVWKDAAVQIFFSLSASWGGLITLSSYNRFKNNCMRDALIVPLLNCATSIFAGFVIFSIMGYMAHELKKPVSEVVDEQFGLAFIAYPEAVARLPISPLWAFLFFFMLITLGLGSQLCIVETVVTSIADEFNLRKKKIWVLAAYCIIAFFMGLICVTQAGNYWVILMDKYAADFALLIFGMSECIGLGWIYGVKNFTNDIRSMLGDRIVDNVLFNWWKLNWCFLTPAVLSFVMLFSWISWEPPMATETYPFPTWAHALGWLLILTVIMWIPLYWIYAFCKAKGDTFRQRLKAMATPEDSWGPMVMSNRRHAWETHNQNGTSMGGQLHLDDEVKSSPGLSAVYVPTSTTESV